MGIGMARRAALLGRFASPCNQNRNTSAVTSADSALVSASPLATTRKRPASFELHFGRVVQGWSINAAGQLSTWANPPVQPKMVGATPRPSSSRASLSERSFQLSHLVRAQFRQCLVPEQHAHSSSSGRLIAPLARSLPPFRPVQARRSLHLTENTVGRFSAAALASIGSHLQQPIRRPGDMLVTMTSGADTDFVASSAPLRFPLKRETKDGLRRDAASCFRCISSDS
jgi:hypothetical protein